jgi:hypothetical protein
MSFETLAKLEVRCAEHPGFTSGCMGCEFLKHAQSEAESLRARRARLMAEMARRLHSRNLIVIGAK